MTIVKDTTLVPVRNLVNHKVVYVLPEINRRVVFEPFQRRSIPASELRMLNYTTGGEVLLHEYLCVESNDLREEFNISSDIVEYDWTIDDIHRILEDLNNPIEELEDALDFAPEGIRELIVDCAVEWRIPDSNRRNVISKMAGVDINKKIDFLNMIQETSEEVVKESPRRRLSERAPERTGRRLQN